MECPHCGQIRRMLTDWQVICPGCGCVWEMRWHLMEITDKCDTKEELYVDPESDDDTAAGRFRKEL